VEDDVTELLGTDKFGVSLAVTERLAKDPAAPTAAAWQFPLLVVVGQAKPAGKLFGVKV
jgi:hypothetical protein